MCLDNDCLLRLSAFTGGFSVNVASLGSVENKTNHQRSTAARQFLNDSMNIKTIVPIINEDTWKAGHQTLVVVCISKDASDKFVERSARFVTSLNSPETIKADVLSLSDGNFYLGLIAAGYEAGGRSKQAVNEFAKRKGYAQVCILESLDDE